MSTHHLNFNDEDFLTMPKRLCDVFGPDFNVATSKLDAFIKSSFLSPAWRLGAIAHLLLSLDSNTEKILLARLTPSHSSKEIKLLEVQANDIDFVQKQLGSQSDEGNVRLYLECLTPLVQDNPPASLLGVYIQALQRFPSESAMFTAMMHPAFRHLDLSKFDMNKKKQYTPTTTLERRQSVGESQAYGLSIPSLIPDRRPSLPQAITNQEENRRQEEVDQRSDKSQANKQSYDVKEFAAWLKSLRLHKYQYVFDGLTFNGIMQIGEAYLQEQAVTKGAIDKIVGQLKYLGDRHDILISIVNDLEKKSDEDIDQIICELVKISKTPFQESTVLIRSQLIATFVQAIVVVSERLLSSDQTRKEVSAGKIIELQNVIEKSCGHKALTSAQKDSLEEVKRKLCEVIPYLKYWTIAPKRNKSLNDFQRLRLNRRITETPGLASSPSSSIAAPSSLRKLWKSISIPNQNSFGKDDFAQQNSVSAGLCSTRQIDKPDKLNSDNLRPIILWTLNEESNNANINDKQRR